MFGSCWSPQAEQTRGERMAHSPLSVVLNPGAPGPFSSLCPHTTWEQDMRARASQHPQTCPFSAPPLTSWSSRLTWRTAVSSSLALPQGHPHLSSVHNPPTAPISLKSKAKVLREARRPPTTFPSSSTSPPLTHCALAAWLSPKHQEGSQGLCACQ